MSKNARCFLLCGVIEILLSCAIEADAAIAVVACTDNRSVWSNIGGSTWEEVNNVPFLFFPTDVDSYGPQFWVLDAGSSVLVSDDGAASWQMQEMPIPDPSTFRAIDLVSQTSAVIAGSGGPSGA